MAKIQAVRECPFDGCTKMIPSSMFACLKHWRSMSKEDQIRIYACFNSYKNGRIFLSELEGIQNQVMQGYRKSEKRLALPDAI